MLLHLLGGSCVDDGDGGAVTVADQDGILDVEFCEQIGEGVQGFLVHVGYGSRLGEEFGMAGAVAGVDGDGASGGVGNFAGKLLPVRDGAESFVEEDEFGSVWIAGGNAVDLEVVAVDFEGVDVGMGHSERA